MELNNWESSLIRYFARFGEGRELDEGMMRPLIVKWAGWAGREMSEERAAALARDAVRAARGRGSKDEYGERDGGAECRSDSAV